MGTEAVVQCSDATGSIACMRSLAPEACPFALEALLHHCIMRRAVTDLIAAYRGRKIALDIARGLHYLHSNSVIHFE